MWTRMCYQRWDIATPAGVRAVVVAVPRSNRLHQHHVTRPQCVETISTRTL